MLLSQNKADRGPYITPVSCVNSLGLLTWNAVDSSNSVRFLVTEDARLYSFSDYLR